MNMARHDAYFAFTGSDHARTVGTYQAHTKFIAPDFAVEHIQGRNAFGDADNQLDARVGCLKIESLQKAAGT